MYESRVIVAADAPIPPMPGGRIEDMAARIRPAAAANLLLWGIAAFFLLFTVWAALTKLDRTVRGQGRVIPSAQLQTVSNLEGGMVKRILVRIGQVVPAGAPLLQLDPTQSSGELGSGRAAYDALAAKIARLQAEVTGAPLAYLTGGGEQAAIERSLHASRMADLSSLLAAAQARVSQAQRGVAEAQASQAARASARDAARRELELIRPLVERGIEPRLSLIQAENAAAVAAGEAAAAAETVARARATVTEAQASLVQQRQDWRSRAADELAAAQGEMAARRSAMPALADRLDRTIVRAPMAGRVNRVLATTVGGSVRPGEPLVEIVPTGERLIVEAALNPKDIAAVRIGQAAKVELTAYESAVYGGLKGRVVSISPDAVIDERTGSSHYLVRVATDRDALIDRAGRRLPIGPGMVAMVSLLGDKRSVLNYILTPITRLQESALRE